MTDISKPQHSERPHSRLGASAAYRFTVCTSSVLASVGFPSYSSDFAREGTAGHEIAQACLENGQDAIEWVDRVVDGFVVDDENWAEPLQLYLDKCRKYMGPGWVWWIERPITLETLNPPEEMYGTADFVAYHAERRLLVVVDLKFGKGIGVEAKGNPQLKYYALGALLSLPMDMSVERIEAYIVQPRIPYGQIEKSDEYDPLELFEWSVWLLERVRIALSPEEAEFVAGPHCKFCPRSGRCAAQAASALEFAKDEFSLITVDETTPAPVFPDAKSLTVQQMSGILNAKEAAVEFFKAVEERAKDEIGRGLLRVPGWMVTDTEGRPKFSGADDDVIAGKLKKTFGLVDEQVWAKKLATPAQVRNAIKAELRTSKGITAKEAEEQAKELIKPMLLPAISTGTKLVPVASGKAHASVRGSEFPLLDA